jgi:hypothetical protein
VKVKNSIAHFSVLLLLGASGCVVYAGDTTQGRVSYEPIDTIEAFRTDFPYSAEFSFPESPVVGHRALLHATFSAERDLNDTLRFQIRVLPEEDMLLDTTSFVWMTPLKKKFEIDVPMTFLLGGTYYISVNQNLKRGKSYSLYQMAASFGIDGNALYFGKHPSPISECPGFFHTTNLDTIRIVEKNRFKGQQRRLGIPFDVELMITPIPRIDSVSTVSFKVTTNTNFVHNIQFQWLYLPTVKIENLAPSWEARPRAGESYTGTFDLIPRRPGCAEVEFKIFGNDPTTRVTGQTHLEIPLRMVFDSSGTMLYFGQSDLWNCKFADDDPLGKQFKQALKFERVRSQYVRKRSQPDFEKIEEESQAEQPEKSVEKTVLDSAFKEMRTKSQTRDSLRAPESEKPGE